VSDIPPEVMLVIFIFVAVVYVVSAWVKSFFDKLKGGDEEKKKDNTQ
jgi:Na+-transporting methylmalonyl-CoA/oxaloacetate decarboxylase gamma subunit